MIKKNIAFYSTFTVSFYLLLRKSQQQILVTGILGSAKDKSDYG
jgi:hypothetical protein